MDAAGQARAQDRIEHVDAAAPVTAGDDELALGPAAHQVRIRLDRERHVLACLQCPDAEHVRLVDAEALAHAGAGVVQRPEGRADAIRDGDDLGGVDPVLVAHVGARELGDGDHALRPAH